MSRMERMGMILLVCEILGEMRRMENFKLIMWRERNIVTPPSTPNSNQNFLQNQGK